MNTKIKEVLAAKSNGQPGLISDPAKELPNLRLSTAWRAKAGSDIL